MFEGEYLYQKKWNGKLYDTNGNIISELINGNGKVKEYDEEYGYISFEGEYLNGKRQGKEKNIIKEKFVSMENILTEKDMEKEQNMDIPILKLKLKNIYLRKNRKKNMNMQALI